MLTPEILKYLLEYNPETGLFMRLVTTNSRALAGTIVGAQSKGRLAIQIDGVKYEASRLAWLYMTGSWPTGVVDHKDGDPTNNRWANLRDVTQRMNVENMLQAPSHNKSCGLLGATWHKRTKRWMAQIKVNRVRQHIGYFDTAEQAHQAYVNRKRLVHAGALL